MVWGLKKVYNITCHLFMGGSYKVKKIRLWFLSFIFVICLGTLVSGCGKQDDPNMPGDIVVQGGHDKKKISMKDGIYEVRVWTDNAAFHMLGEKQSMAVKDKYAVLYVVLEDETVEAVARGRAKKAAKGKVEVIKPQLMEIEVETDKYELRNEVRIPVPYLDKEFDVAILIDGEWQNQKMIVYSGEEDTQQQEEKTSEQTTREKETSEREEKQTTREEKMTDEKEERKTTRDNEEMTTGAKEEKTTQEKTTGKQKKKTVDPDQKPYVEKLDEDRLHIHWDEPGVDYIIVNEERYPNCSVDDTSDFYLLYDEADDELVFDAVIKDKLYRQEIDVSELK